MQIPLKAFAVAAIRVFKDSHLAFAITAHHGEGVFDGQCAKVYGAEFGYPLFGQVALAFGINEVALQQKVALGVGIENVGFIDTNFV